jgi:hypothetical protein
VYKLQKDLLQEKTKVKALSEELENPMNIHRWRKLEGSGVFIFILYSLKFGFFSFFLRFIFSSPLSYVLRCTNYKPASGKNQGQGLVRGAGKSYEYS